MHETDPKAPPPEALLGALEDNRIVAFEDFLRDLADAIRDSHYRGLEPSVDALVCRYGFDRALLRVFLDQALQLARDAEAAA